MREQLATGRRLVRPSAWLLALALLLLLTRDPLEHLCGLPGGLAVLAVIAWQGPSGLQIRSGLLDATGVRLDELGLHVPWSSIARLDARVAQVRIVIDGPVTPTGRVPRVWTGRAVRRIAREGHVDLIARRTEEIVWAAERYLRSGAQAPPHGEDPWAGPPRGASG